MIKEGITEEFQNGMADSEINNKCNRAIDIMMGPKIDQAISYRASHFPKQQSGECSPQFLENIFMGPHSNTGVINDASFRDSKQVLFIPPNVPEEDNKLNPRIASKKHSLSRVSKWKAPVTPGSYRFSRKSLKNAFSMAQMTLQDLLFRQKLLRFINNLRTHAGLIETLKLNSAKLRIINDQGANENEIISQNIKDNIQTRTQKLFKKRLKGHELSFNGRIVATAKKLFLQILSLFLLWVKVAYTFIEGNIPVVKPFGKFKIIWEIFMLTLTLWNLISFSLIISFDISIQESVSLSIPFLSNAPSLFIFQITCLVLYSTDIIIKMNTSFYHDGENVCDRKRILKNYIREGMIFDMLGTIPFWQYLKDDYSEWSYVLLFLLFKIYPLQKFFQNINEALLNIEGKLEAAYNLIKLLLTVLIVCHIFACMWHYQALGDLASSNWVNKLALQSAFWSERYLRSLYFTVVTMTTVGYGDISPSNTKEYLIAMACMLIGSGLIGYSINSIGAILKKKNKEELEFRTKMQLLNGYLKKNEVQENLKIRVRKYLEYIWKIENSANEKKCEELLKELPKTLREELLLNTRIWAMRLLFGGKFKDSTISRIVRKLTHARFSKEEWIFQEGDFFDNSLFIIAKGNVDIILNQGNSNSQNQIVIDSLKAGENFGYQAFILDEPRQFSAKAASVCTLFRLDRRDFIEIIKENREDYEKFCMMKDKIFLYRDLEITGKKCKICGESYHSINCCPYLTYQPFRSVIIKRHLHSNNQERRRIKRKKKAFTKPEWKKNTLSIIEITRNSLRRFQEENSLIVNALGDFYAMQNEASNTLFKHRGSSSSKLMEDQMIESKLIFVNSKDELSPNEPDNTKFPEEPPQKELEGNLENSYMMASEQKYKQMKRQNPTLLPVPFSDYIFKLESHHEQHSKKTTHLLNSIEEINIHIPQPDDMKISTSKLTKSPKNQVRKSKIITEEKDHGEEDNDGLSKSRRTIVTVNSSKNDGKLFDRDFDNSHVFSFYFPYNNRTAVIDSISREKLPKSFQLVTKTQIK